MPSRNRFALVATIAALTLALARPATASPEETARDEIDHLLNFVAASSCTFIRNGSEYPPDKARDHLAAKFRFAGGRISTAEEFIRYLATQSSLSGEPYHVRCGRSDALAGVWLNDELARYRKATRVQAAR